MTFFRLALIVTCLALSGCPDRSDDTSHHNFSWWRGDDLSGVRRIAVMPFAHGAKVGRTGDTVAPAFAASLRNLGTVQVVEVDLANEGMIASDPVHYDMIAAGDLLRLRDRYHVDAVLVGRIDRMSSYDPMAMDLSLHLVSCRDGQSVWSSEGSFDGRSSDVQADIASWYRSRQIEEGGKVLDWHSTLQSPSRFARYVADRMTATAVGQATQPPAKVETKVEAKKVEAKVEVDSPTQAEAAPKETPLVVEPATSGTPTHSRYGRN